jgi:hypothetical protein
MKKIMNVYFPQGDAYEGSPCIITYDDGSRENTIGDTFYQRCHERNLSKEDIKAISRYHPNA